MELIMDSGAYSAWRKGVVIDLDAYIQYCLDHSDTLDNFVQLDVIPGKYGYKDIPYEEREAVAAEGYENYLYMISKGMPKDRTIVVFHQGDHFHWLERLREEKIPYIGLSPGNDRSTTEKMDWLDECMYYVTDRKGLPLMKWHGFGVTSVPIIRRFPWYSVDSVTWLVFAWYGNILLPPQRGGQPDWEADSPIIVGVSSSLVSKARSTEGDHISTFTEYQKNYVEEFLSAIGMSIGESHFDIVPSSTKLGRNQGWRGKKNADGTRRVETIVKRGVANSLGARTRVNAYYFAKIRQTLPSWPWSYKFRHGFGLTRMSKRTDMLCPYTVPDVPTRIYFAGQAHEYVTTGRFLKKYGLEESWRSLVSYAYLDRCNAMIAYKKELESDYSR